MPGTHRYTATTPTTQRVCLWHAGRWDLRYPYTRSPRCIATRVRAALPLFHPPTAPTHRIVPRYAVLRVWLDCSYPDHLAISTVRSTLYSPHLPGSSFVWTCRPQFPFPFGWLTLVYSVYFLVLLPFVLPVRCRILPGFCWFGFRYLRTANTPFTLAAATRTRVYLPHIYTCLLCATHLFAVAFQNIQPSGCVPPPRRWIVRFPSR